MLDVVAAENPAGAARAAAERKLLGVDHAEAGALVARASQVEEPVELVIAFHHGVPMAARTGLARGAFACVIIADEVVGLASRKEPD